MSDRHERAVAVVGVGAVLPDAPTAPAFWKNVCEKRYSIIDVPEDRWRVADYYDPDPQAPEKTYTKIGSWVRGFSFDWKRFHIPPRVVAAMDEGQQWGLTIASEALADYGYPERPLDLERTGVIFGAAMGGELQHMTVLRIYFPEFARPLREVSAFKELPEAVRQEILLRWRESLDAGLPPITEDSMPGELANILSGRVANVLNLRGPNFVTDAACASSFAALESAVDLLVGGHCDALLTGGIDRNMGASTFVKFCKIGALSATGSRPFGDGADGFVMGEGSAAFLLRRLEDAERDGDRVYAVIRGMGAASDGKGKGITAPNPVGQKLAVERAWRDAGVDPATATLIEAHGTSTRVGDVAELEALAPAFAGAPRGSIALGSAKSNIGHLKAGAGAAGLLKAVLAVHHKVLPPTLNAHPPNPAFDFAASSFRLNHDLCDWTRNGTPRRAGVSAYGFGGTNFHLVLEEHVPGALTRDRRPASVAVSAPASPSIGWVSKPPVRGIVALGAADSAGLKQQLQDLLTRVEGDFVPANGAPDAQAVAAHERLLIDFADGGELKKRLQKAQKAIQNDTPKSWRALQSQGVFRGSGKWPGKLAFLFPGQGSQYLNMARNLAEEEPVVRAVFEEADRVTAPLLGKPLSQFLFVDAGDAEAVAAAEEELKQTAITQPAVLTVDVALTRLLAEYGVLPDMVMGHSLGEYAGLVAAGVLPFPHALEASAARGREMTRVSLDDNGWMAAVMAPTSVVEETLRRIDGYVVPANLNSGGQSVIGGESGAVAAAIEAFGKQGYQAQRLQVSHAFHTKIVAPAGGPLRKVLDRLRVAPPRLPVVANVTGDLYPTGVEAIKDMLVQQIASPVQWVKGLEKLYAEGVRVLIEVGPKRALKGFVDDVLGDRPDVVSLATNHPRSGGRSSFNQALCGLYAAGLGTRATDQALAPRVPAAPQGGPQSVAVTGAAPAAAGTDSAPLSSASIDNLSRLLTQALQQLDGGRRQRRYDRNAAPEGSLVISGTGLGLPGSGKAVMDPHNADRILHGEQFVDLIPERFRYLMTSKQVTRLVKSADGSGRFEIIEDPKDVIKLAGRPGSFDLTAEYGVPAKLVEALDTTSQLAMAAGLDALREAGIPLVQTYKKTTTGKYLPERWLLPESMRDDTGVIFASAFPGLDRFADETRRFFHRESRLTLRGALDDLRQRTRDAETLREIQRRIQELDEELARDTYSLDRRYLLRVLPMGHSQFAEYIGARGPNAVTNAACASTAQAVCLAEDWIRTGRCRRVLVVGADNVTGDNLLEWIGAGFLATGAAATDDKVEDAAIPFDRRRHGTLLGMGACALVVESQDSVEERGMRGIVELLASELRNSAFHAMRLDVDHICGVMNDLITSAERRFGINRHAMAAETVFMSHETFTPARGGSASAEVKALRDNFGPAANEIVIANTKGFTGHPMGVGIEDVIAVKILEQGIVPPVPNLKEIDPELGNLNLSRGGRYPVNYAIHLAAGFGSQIAMTLTRRIPGALDRVDHRAVYDRWLADITGYDRAETEVEKRVLRVKAQGAPPRRPAPSGWVYGTGPTRHASLPGDGGQRPPSTLSPAAPRPLMPASLPAPPPAPRAPEPPPAPVPEPVPTAAPSAPAPALSGPDAVTRKVLEIVADKTGYPTDMLEMDLDLEADLGVDTVKQAETFAAVRETYDIPREDQLKLRDFPTLNHVVKFVLDRRPDLAAAAATAATPAAAVPAPSPSAAAPSPTTGTSLDAVTRKVLEIVADKTGYPTDMLELDLDLEADLGVDTVKQAETFAAVRETYDIPREDQLKLRDFPTLNHVVKFVLDRRPDLAAAAATAAASVAAAAPLATAPAPGPAPAPTAPPTSASPDAVVQKVLEIVADKTGYPTDMLELDLDLEADLGVDTVKQAETFAAVRETYDIPREDQLKLRDFPTLNHVVKFVLDHRPDLAGAATSATAAAPPAAPATSVTATPAAGAGDSVDAVTRKVLEIVADKTGYPTDMLELDLDLEADLGVDTVKQAETFAAVRETYDIPREDQLKLRDFPTLNHVVKFVLDHRPDLAGAPAPTASPTAAPAAAPATAPVPTAARLEDADRFPRRVPIPSLRPTLDLCKATGVALDEGTRVVLVPDHGGVAGMLTARLAKRGVVVLNPAPAPEKGAKPSRSEPLATEELVAQVKTWLAEGPIHGVFWLPALDVEPALSQLELEGFRELNRQRVKALYATMRALYDAVAGPGTFLISATRMGGFHGQDRAGATAPLGGAVAGFTKAYKRERPEALVKVVDFSVSSSSRATAEALIADALSDPGVVEIGYHDDQRWTVGLTERPARDGNPGLTLGPDSVFLVTGAAGGITSAIVADLAAASKGSFYLLDLVTPPAADDPKVALLRSDRDRLKSVLIEEARARGERPLPPQIEAQILALERQEAAQRATLAVTAAGGTAHYRPVNLLDGRAVASVVDEIRERHGRIDVLLHAGGLEISRDLPQKEPKEFDLVFDVKSDGFFSLLKAAEGMPIGATVVFSSVAGRFGNGGQTDYSAANALLCSLSSHLRTTRPETRAIAIDWTAWGGIGMATRGSIPKIMEAAGIEMLPPEVGVPTVRRELVAGGASGEVLVAGRLGILAQRWDETGGLDPEAAMRQLAGRKRPLLMTGKVTAAHVYDGLLVETTLDPNQQPFLFDHQIEGVPVLPGVMATEAFAELASFLCPGYRVAAVVDEKLEKPFKYYRMLPHTLHLSGVAHPGEDGEIVVTTRLRSIIQPKPELPPVEKVHFQARVRLTRKPAAKPKVTFKRPALKRMSIEAPSIYQVYFHGPAYKVLERVQVEGDRAIGLMAAELPPNSEPAGVEALLAPRLVELCLQTAGIWEVKTKRRLALPAGIDSLLVHRSEKDAGGKRLYAVVEARQDGESFDAKVLDETGRVFVELDGYRTVVFEENRELPGKAEG